MAQPHGPAMLDSLTEREVEILRLIADGYSNSEIAGRLFLTLGTIKWYNTQIFGKLAVKSRAQAIVRAREWHLLEDEIALVSTPLTAVKSNLPAFPIPFVGREHDLEQVKWLLSEPDCRLLTLVAPGGMGKTRLAVEAAQRLHSQFAEGVYFVSLAPLTSSDDILSTIASSMNLLFPEQGDVQVGLLDYLRSKTVLLVMDNFDTLLGGAGVVSDLLGASPNLKVLATSRERLNLQEETIYRVDGLELPADETAAANNSAVQLFLGRARGTKPHYEPDTDGLKHIVHICRLLDGMPLAILLAGAWIEMLSPGEIVEELRRGLDFLQTDLRNMPERHRSIRGVFESAWNMLNPSEQAAFARLTVFRGGFTREAAEYVTSASLRVLMTLVNKSLLHRDAEGRYQIHELLRQYAEERLHQMQDAGSTYDAHSRYYLDLLCQHEAALSALGDSPALKRIESDIENLRAAWNRALEHSQFELLDKTLNNLFLFCNRVGRLEDGLKAFDAAVQAAERFAKGVDPRFLLRLRECRGRARSAMGLSHFDGAAADLFYARMGAHQLGDAAWERDLLVKLGQLYRKTERHNDAQRHLSQVMDYARVSGDQRAVADSLYHLGTVAWDEGDNHQAYRYHQEAVSITQSIGLRDVVAVQAYHGLGEAVFTAGMPDLALENFQQSLALAQEVGDVSYEAENLEMIGWVWTGMLGFGDYQKALDFFPRALAISRDAHLDWHRMCAYIGLGLAQGAVGDYETGLTNIWQALRMAESVGLARFRSMALDALGQHYQDLNLLKEAEAAHSQGVNLMHRAESTFWLSRLQANYAVDRMRQDDLNVERELLEALDISLNRNQGFHTLRCLEGLAEWGVKRRHPDIALRYADDLLNQAEPRGMQEMVAQAHRWRGEALLVAGDINEAKTELQCALELGEKVGRVRLLWDVRMALAAYHRQTGDEAGALDYEMSARRHMTGVAESPTDETLRVGLS